MIRGAVISTAPEQDAISVRATSGVVALKADSKALIMLDKRPATLAQFEAGRDVTVRYRASDKPPCRVYDLVDTPTWAWLKRMRQEITQVTVSAVDEQGLDVVDAAAKAPFRFRVTDKTRIEIGGTTVALADLSPNSALFVAPRLLPNGSTMAVAIADSSALAARLRERSQPTVTGTIRTWSASDRTLALRSRAGDDRKLVLSAECTVRRDGRNATVGALKPGLTVTAHVRRNVEGEERVERLTIQRAPSSGGKKKAP